MRSRLVRLGLVLVLLGAGAWAAVEGWRARAISTHSTALDTRVDTLLATLVEVGTAQAEYVAPGQDAGAALARVPELLRGVSMSTGAISQFVRVPAASPALGTIADAASRLALADARARDSLLLGDIATASYVIFGDARQAIADMAGSLATLRSTEASARDAQREAGTARAWRIAEATAALWVLGLVTLAVVPGARRRSDATENEALALSIRDRTSGSDTTLAGIAELCTGIARVTTADALGSLLERGATLLEASTLTLWMNTGDSLIAVRTAGPGSANAPDPDGDAYRAAAAAWRDQHVVSCDGSSSPTIVAAPISGPETSTGVLTIETEATAAHDPGLPAFAAILAAQLATVIPASPSTIPATGPDGRTGAVVLVS